MTGRIEAAVRYSEAGQMVLDSGRDECPTASRAGLAVRT